MSRPFNALSVVILAAASLAIQGCRTHTIYRDVYAPKRNYFVPPEDKKDVLPPPTPTPTTTTAPVTPQVTPPGGAAAPTLPGGSATPAPAPASSPSGIPGL